MEKLNKIYTILFSIFFATIPITEHIQAIPNILMLALIAFFLFVVKRDDWKKLDLKIMIALLILIFIVLLGYFGNKRWEDFSFLKKLFIVPVIYILSIPIKNHRKPIYFFLFGSFSLLLGSLIKLSNYYLTNGKLNLDVGSEVNLLLLGERPFLGVIYLTSFCISIYSISQFKNKKIKFGLAVLSVLFCGFILFISARLSIVTLLLITLSTLFYMKNKRKAILLSSTGLVLLVIAGFLNPNFISRLTAGFEQDKFDFQKIIQLEPRTHIWQCSADIIKSGEVGFTGMGFRNTVIHLENCFATHDGFFNEGQREFFLESKFNTHNQFLGFYIGSGIFSLLAFIALFIILFQSNYRNQFAFSLVLIIFFFCVFENVFNRQLGVMLFGVVIYILSAVNSHKNQKSISAHSD